MIRTAATWGRKYTCKNNLKSLPKATSRATPKALLSSIRTALAVLSTKSSERDSWGTGGPFLHTIHKIRGLYHQNKRKFNHKLHFAWGLSKQTIPIYIYKLIYSLIAPTLCKRKTTNLQWEQFHIYNAYKCGRSKLHVSRFLRPGMLCFV